VTVRTLVRICSINSSLSLLYPDKLTHYFIRSTLPPPSAFLSDVYLVQSQKFSQGSTAKKQAVLDAVSGTNNGKTATPNQQQIVLRRVRELEQSFPPFRLADASQAARLDGIWYLQYTSPSTVGDDDDNNNNSEDAWQPSYATEGDSRIETRPFQARGTVSAAGIRVDTANKVVQQILDVSNARVANDVVLEWGRVYVAGSFRPSDMVPNRAVVSFDTAEITVAQQGGTEKGWKIQLGWFFWILSKIRGTTENGWLETTFVDDTLRIGRGNKGTLFVLTRDVDAVQP
jgi:hypothetical protein